jgi:hypothetical protein
MFLGAVFLTEPPLKIDFQHRSYSYSASVKFRDGILRKPLLLEKVRVSVLVYV